MCIFSPKSKCLLFLFIIISLQGCSSKSVSLFPTQAPDTLALRRLVHMLDSAEMFEYALDIERLLTGENSQEYATLLEHLGNSSEGEEHHPGMRRRH